MLISRLETDYAIDQRNTKEWCFLLVTALEGSALSVRTGNSPVVPAGNRTEVQSLRPGAKPSLLTLWDSLFCPKSLDGRVQLYLTLRGWDGAKGWRTLGDSSKRLGSVHWCMCWSKQQQVAALQEVSVVAGCSMLWPVWQSLCMLVVMLLMRQDSVGAAGPRCEPGSESSHTCWRSPPCSSQGCPACSIPTKRSKPSLTCGSHPET